MLNQETLSQLSNLKKEIRASLDVQQGTVRGTTGRYGFVMLDDGREAFLSPEQMERVFHNDRIEVKVTKNDKDQYEAQIEKLLFSPQKQVAGKYLIKGKGHFVVVDYQQHTRWIFIPPRSRQNAKDGHLVTARITQHPFETGKAQAKILNNIGTDITTDNLRKFSLAMFQLYEGFPKEVMEQAKAIHSNAIDTDSNRTDLRTLPFITIDSVSTRDMDDALAIETTDQGWRLSVAIADPGSEIAPDSTLDNIAQKRAQTLYFPGKPVPMLPESLTLERYSLVSGKDRLALVARLDIDHSGKITAYEFIPAIVQSKAKLSYQQVSALLNGQDYVTPAHLGDATEHTQMLTDLKKCADTLKKYRQQYQLVNEHRDDFILIINDKGKLESVEKIERTLAHVIVEEAMIATNICAGALLSEHQTGICVAHPGYRNERREYVETLLSEKLGKDNIGDTSQLSEYIKVNQQLQQDATQKNLFAVQQRFQQGSELSLATESHFGLGVEAYATVTSPIRRYQDLVNQRIIHELLAKKSKTKLKPKNIAKLNEAISNSRGAVRFMEQWLIADYMQDKIGHTFKGYIALLTNQGVGVRLNATGIEGFVAAKKDNKNSSETKSDKISFNNQRMELTWNGNELFYDQDVEVKLAAVDMGRKKLAFEWVES